jgi:hypothetical protein
VFAPRLVLVTLIVLGCRASVQANAKASTKGQSDADLDAELRKERASAGPMVAASARSPGLDVNRPLLGARSDLTLVPAEVPGQCTCLRVALGPASLGAFRWKGAAPATDEQTQLVVALSSEGSGCTNPKGSLGASYWGYRRSGDDVVVYVENAVKGPPLTSGAIIPKPFGSGQVYVAPVAKGVPYGSAPGGKGQCKIGNPGVVRTVPVTPDERGADPTAAGDAAPDMLTGR